MYINVCLSVRVRISCIIEDLLASFSLFVHRFRTMLTNNLSMTDLINSTSMISHGEHLFVLILSIISLVILVIGLIGNALVIYVVLHYGPLKTVTNTYLLHLAFADLIFLSGIPFFLSSIHTRSWMFGSLFCKTFFLSQGVNQYTSILILALLSFDRFLAVCHPSKSITWRSRVNPKFLLIFIWIFSFILMLPIILFTTTHGTGHGKIQCIIDLPLSESRTLYFLFVLYTSLLTFFIPISLMCYFHIKIVHHLQYNIPKQHRRSRTSTRTRRKVTILVLCVISIHLLCCSPYWTFQMFATSGLLPQTSAILISTSSITQILLFVNSSINPILYAFISEIFRASFKRVFAGFCTNNNQFRREIRVIESNTVKRKASRRTKLTSAIPLKSNHPQTDHPNIATSPSQTDIHSMNRPQNLSFSAPPPVSIFLSEISDVPDA